MKRGKKERKEKKRKEKKRKEKKRKKERTKERKKERTKERKRGRERERREKKRAGVPSYEQSSRGTPKKERGDPEYSIQENTKKQRKKRGGKGKGGD